jgi:hypothetical protein
MTITAIDLKIANSAECTGAGATDYDAQACAEHIARGLRRYCREHYPEAEVDVAFVPETQSLGNKTHAWGDDDEYEGVTGDDDVELELHTESERPFAEWCQFYAAPIRSTWIATGAARREGRQPSHDGEYVTVYAWMGAPMAWIASDNGGVCATDDETAMAQARENTPRITLESAEDDEGDVTAERIKLVMGGFQQAADDARERGDDSEENRLTGYVSEMDGLLDALAIDTEAADFATRVASGEDIGDVVDGDHRPGYSAADVMRAGGWPVPSDEDDDADA